MGRIGLTRLLAALGRSSLNIAATVGSMALLLGQLSSSTTRLQWDRAELTRGLYRMGVSSIPIVALTAVFVGAIMVVQAAPLVQRFDAKPLLGWAAGFSTLREIGPLLTALMLSGRIGANNTAELGTMVVTDQIDALRALAIDPMGYLLVPRFLAMVITFFLATVFSDVLALFGAACVGQVLLSVDVMTFFHGVTGGRLGAGDVWHGLIKSVAFGVVVGLCSCLFGISTSGGAPGVGKSVTQGVVVSAMAIFALDYLLSFLIG